MQWIPNWGRERIYGMIENRPDWCISRQRAWGVPIPAFYCDGCGALLLTIRSWTRVDRMFARARRGRLVRARAAEELLPPGTHCPTVRQTAEFRQGDGHPRRLVRLRGEPRRGAGGAPGACAGRPTCTSKAATSTAAGSTRRCWPRVGTRGQRALPDGADPRLRGGRRGPQDVQVRRQRHRPRRRSSRSTAPRSCASGWPPQDYRDDIRISDEILTRLAEAYRRIRNTCRFLLGNLYDFDPATDACPPAEMPEIDRWALHRLQQLVDGAAGPTTTTSSTSSTTRCTTSAPWT